jgi:small-conductance mechanosensitive channel
VDFLVPQFYCRSTRSPLVPHWPDFLASHKLLFFCCCVDFAVDVCRILLRSLLPAPRALACSQVSSLRFLLPRFFLLVILSASVCFFSWQQGSALLFTTVPRWKIIFRSSSAFQSPELPLRRCSALSSSVLLTSPFTCHITSSILFVL